MYTFILNDPAPLYKNYIPSPADFREVGGVGIFLFTSIAVIAIYLLINRVTNKTSRLFFYLIIGMCLCELPRYFDLEICMNYANTATYAIHQLGATFFFAAFSVVAYQWSGLLELGSYSKAIYSKTALIYVNLIFGANDIVNSVFCILSLTLDDYFKSTPYEVYMMAEGVRNLIYSSFLTYYGIRLIRRFSNYSAIEDRANSKSGCSWLCTALFEPDTNIVFARAVVKLTIVLSIATLSFLLRVVMVTFKLIAIHDPNVHVTSKYFPLFGLLWFTLGDFIPRCLPTLSFMLLMQSNRGKVRMNSTEKEVSKDNQSIQSVSSGSVFRFLGINNSVFPQRTQSRQYSRMSTGEDFLYDSDEASEANRDTLENWTNHGNDWFISPEKDMNFSNTGHTQTDTGSEQSNHERSHVFSTSKSNGSSSVGIIASIISNSKPVSNPEDIKEPLLTNEAFNSP